MQNKSVNQSCFIKCVKRTQKHGTCTAELLQQVIHKKHKE